jgi:hypothetical protein
MPIAGGDDIHVGQGYGAATGHLEQPCALESASKHLRDLIDRGPVVGGFIQQLADMAPHFALAIARRNGDPPVS